MMRSFAVSAPDECALQRGMERQILMLLHRATKAEALAAVPLMGDLCRELHTANPVDALARIVQTALDGEDEDAKELQRAVFDVDFNVVASNAQVAARSGVSRRHFQRRRAKAVAAIARHVRNIVETRYLLGAVPQPRGRRPVVAWRYERERAAFSHARERGAAFEMCAVAANLGRLAETRAERAAAAECKAEAYVRLGRDAAALDQLGEVSPGASAWVRAAVALSAGNLEAADLYARSALEAALPHRERCRALVMLAQVRLARGLPWRPPAETCMLEAESWECCALESEHARHLAVEGRFREAEALASAVYARSEAFAYEALAARCAAVLQTTALASGDVEASRFWRARAVERIMPTQDRLAASGLFLADAYAGCGGMDPRLAGAIYARLCVVVPQILGDGESQTRGVHVLIAAVFDRIAGVLSDAERVDASLRDLLRADAAFVHYAPRLVEPIRETLAFAGVAITGRPRLEVDELIEATFVRRARKLQPMEPRTIAVSVPSPRESQTGPLEHSSRDDGESAAGAVSGSTRSDLRVRLVPVRSVAGPPLSWKPDRAVVRTSRAAAPVADPC